MVRMENAHEPRGGEVLDREPSEGELIDLGSPTTWNPASATASSWAKNRRSAAGNRDDDEIGGEGAHRLRHPAERAAVGDSTFEETVARVVDDCDDLVWKIRLAPQVLEQTGCCGPAAHDEDSHWSSGDSLGHKFAAAGCEGRHDRHENERPAIDVEAGNP